MSNKGIIFLTGIAYQICTSQYPVPIFDFLGNYFQYPAWQDIIQWLTDYKKGFSLHSFWSVSVFTVLAREYYVVQNCGQSSDSVGEDY